MRIKILLSLLALATLAACGKDEPAAPAEQASAPEPLAAAPSAPATPETAAAASGNETGRLKYGGICAGCHGKNGEGQGIFPKVAGQSAEVLAAKLRDYKAGKQMGQQTAMMAPNAQNLSEEDIDALAAYMAKLGG
ncbi:MAG: c-type cytochrome [Thiobacillus sp.]|nr:c-type cytochrome [Thiobacillus sp.]